MRGCLPEGDLPRFHRPDESRFHRGETEGKVTPAPSRPVRGLPARAGKLPAHPPPSWRRYSLLQLGRDLLGHLQVILNDGQSLRGPALEVGVLRLFGGFLELLPVLLVFLDHILDISLV